MTDEQQGTEIAVRSETTGVAMGRAFLVAPRSLEEAMSYAKLLASSAFVPRDYQGKAGDVLAAIQFGAEIGLPPLQALQGIAVVNGRPSVWGDAAVALVEASGLLEWKREWIDGEGDRRIAHCQVKRRGKPEPIERTFGVGDATTAKLWNKAGPWTTNPARMLQMRARGFAFRDEFADVLKGLFLREEAQDIEPADPLPAPIHLPQPTAALASDNPAAATDPAAGAATGAAGPGAEDGADGGDQGDDALITEDQRQRLFSALHKRQMSFKDFAAWCADNEVASSAKLTVGKFPAALAWAEGREE